MKREILSQLLTEKGSQQVFLWGGLLIAIVVIGGLAIMFLRRRLRDSDSASKPDAGFSLSELRAMRDRGEITSEEYEQTRARVIAKVKGAVQSPSPRDDSDALPP